jgi:hypothetical protein
VAVHIDVGVVAETREAAPGWRLRYTLVGPVALLTIPPPQGSGPADGLWRHTCFEAFVGTAQGSAYREFNFSPSGEWAAYSFSAERIRDEQDESHRRHLVPVLGRPQLDEHRLVLEAWLPTQALPAAPNGEPLFIGLSTVIETHDGQLSYWALNHPRDEPDFHHSGGRTCRLASPSSAFPHPQHPASTAHETRP